MPSYRSRHAQPLEDHREAELSAQVRELAKRCGWPLAYHTFDSRRSEAGFPDWVFVRAGAMVALELKRAGEKARPEQAVWIAMLDSVPGVRAAVIHPDELQVAADLLSSATPTTRRGGPA